MSGVRLDLDRESAGVGLVTLVLALVELLRQLMERQALRRLELGDLSPEQIERWAPPCCWSSGWASCGSTSG